MRVVLGWGGPGSGAQVSSHMSRVRVDPCRGALAWNPQAARLWGAVCALRAAVTVCPRDRELAPGGECSLDLRPLRGVSQVTSVRHSDPERALGRVRLRSCPSAHLPPWTGVTLAGAPRPRPLPCLLPCSTGGGGCALGARLVGSVPPDNSISASCPEPSHHTPTLVFPGIVSSYSSAPRASTGPSGS